METQEGIGFSVKCLNLLSQFSAQIVLKITVMICIRET